MHKLFLLFFLTTIPNFGIKKVNYMVKNSIITSKLNTSQTNNNAIYTYINTDGNLVITNKWHDNSKQIQLNNKNIKFRDIESEELYFIDTIGYNKKQLVLYEELKSEQQQYIKEKNILDNMHSNKLNESDIGYNNYIQELKQNLNEHKSNIEILQNLLNKH
jgi:hypothetical protein